MAESLIERMNAAENALMVAMEQAMGVVKDAQATVAGLSAEKEKLLHDVEPLRGQVVLLRKEKNGATDDITKIHDEQRKARMKEADATEIGRAHV